MVDRSQIRQQMRQQRNALSLQRRSDAADDVAQLINRSRFYRHSQRIACYMANDNELSLEPLIERIWRAGKCCYLPVLDSIHRNRLCFAAYRPDSIMRLNRFGIPEPLYKKGELIRAQSLDLVMTPLVAFDKAGNRLGMGGGFYDRSLAFLLHRHHWHKPRLCGVGYEFQQVKRLLCQPWDVPLSAIATEKILYQAV
ncbi:MAG: 5-formyltetrahydrofolate cyclo-ligase [Thiotrichaceae bacterium]|nr:5-formyltetrahydrofolate cyclo-ligase [Thiotrichaceae bacterium]PCI10261.1 MAG: 5-formyltetrahydrofolate cyclo-ligase [Thiotrichales bacterium]PCI12223.1 MAG: 5-formyltetrahydrofolate cyclo-ligase [Thiotrichales bacterium]